MKTSRLAVAALSGAVIAGGLVTVSPPAAVAAPGAANTATMVIIDSSGSMSGNDPFDYRKDGANTYLGVSLADDEVGIVDFDDSVQSVQNPVAVGANRATLQAAIASVDSSGGTDLGAGLQAGCDSLKLATAPPDKRAAIFLTDGEGSYNNEASCFAAEGWKVYAIALGDFADDVVLQGIAADTGGRFIKLDPARATCIFGQIRNEIGGGVYDESACDPVGNVTQGGTQLLNITVDPNTGQISVTINYAFAPVNPRQAPRGTSQRAAAGTDLKLTLIDPNGLQFNRDLPGSTTTVTQDSATVTVPNPVAGQWQAKVDGVSVPNGASQPFSISLVQLVAEAEPDPGNDPEQPGATVERPKIAGDAVIGGKLTVSNGSWDRAIQAYEYAWYRGDALISGATTNTYLPVAADAGQALTAVVRATAFNGAMGVATSDAVTVAKGAAPTASVPPALAGTPKIGETLSVTSGTWSSSKVTFTYQWLLDGAPIGGGTGSTLLLDPSYLGKAVSAQVTAKEPGYLDGTALSAAVTVAKGSGATATQAPVISGEPELDEVVRVSHGTWSLPGLTFTYQWLRDGAPIDGATASYYKVSRADVGRALSATVTATKEGNDPGSATAAPVTVEEIATTISAVVLKPSKPRYPSRARIQVDVDAGDRVPVGEVVVRTADGTEVGRVTLGESAARGGAGNSLANYGVRQILLSLLDAGLYSLVVQFLGNDLFGPSSTTLDLKIRKPKRG